MLALKITFQSLDEIVVQRGICGLLSQHRLVLIIQATNWHEEKRGRYPHNGAGIFMMISRGSLCDVEVPRGEFRVGVRRPRNGAFRLLSPEQQAAPEDDGLRDPRLRKSGKRS